MRLTEPTSYFTHKDMNITRKLPIGVQSFKVLREDRYIYVDKTGYFFWLVQSGCVYFLSRLRRFGKSLKINMFVSSLYFAHTV